MLRLPVLGFFVGLFWITLIALSWSPSPYWPDALNYAVALVEEQLVAHPPGYLFFMLIGHAIHLIVSDPYASMQGATLLLTIGAIYLISILIYRATANYLIANYLTMAFAFSWGVLLISQTGTSHSSDLFSVAILLLASLPFLQSSVPRRLDYGFLGLAIVIVAGFRLSTLMFHIPFLLYLTISHSLFCDNKSLRISRIYSLAFTYFCAILFVFAIQVIVIHLSGGWQIYSEHAASNHKVFNRPGSIILSGINTSTLLNIFRAMLWFCIAAGPLLLFAIFINRAALRDRVFQSGILSCLTTLGFCAVYICPHPGYLAAALPGLFLAVGKIWQNHIGKPNKKSLHWIPLAAAVFGALLFIGLAPIPKPLSPRDAALNGLLLQYGVSGARQAIYGGISDWLIIGGFTDLLPPGRVEERERMQESARKKEMILKTHSSKGI